MTVEELSCFTSRAAWACVECGSDQLTAKLDGGEAIPDTGHFVTETFTCPVLMPDSAAMVQCFFEVWEALAEAGCPTPQGYVMTGEPAASVRGAV